jgi:hypothetical protein
MGVAGRADIGGPPRGIASAMVLAATYAVLVLVLVLQA